MPTFDINNPLDCIDLYSQITDSPNLIGLGEVLWDVFEDSTRLGGAPLNFIVNASRMGHRTVLISALGDDELGRSAREAIEGLSLDTRFISTTRQLPTGTARVQTGQDGHTEFRILRPAAYDSAELSRDDLERISIWAPRWLYYGTLFSSRPHGLKVLHDLIRAVPNATRFYDVNLRPASYSPELIRELLDLADVVKLNEAEMKAIAEFAGLSLDSIEVFCRSGSAAYGWKAVCVTMGARGCAVLSNGEYAEADGYNVQVVDTVGAGDGFAAAFLHGLDQQLNPADIAVFANRVGATIASFPGAIPDWNMRQMLAGVQ